MSKKLKKNNPKPKKNKIPLKNKCKNLCPQIRVSFNEQKSVDTAKTNLAQKSVNELQSKKSSLIDETPKKGVLTITIKQKTKDLQKAVLLKNLEV